MGITKKREMYKVNEMVEMLSKPGALINLVGCHGSGKSEILSVLGQLEFKLCLQKLTLINSK